MDIKKTMQGTKKTCLVKRFNIFLLLMRELRETLIKNSLRRRCSEGNFENCKLHANEINFRLRQFLAW
jgi:hypothetical protein